MRFPHLAHRSAAAHKLHSTPQPDRLNLISGKNETSSRLPGPFSLFLPESCPNNRNRCRTPAPDRLPYPGIFAPSWTEVVVFLVCKSYDPEAPLRVMHDNAAFSIYWSVWGRDAGER